MEPIIKDPEIAGYVSNLLLNINQQLIGSLERVSGGCPEEEHLAYKRNVARLVNVIFEHFLEPIYQQHPSLKPPDLDM